MCNSSFSGLADSKLCVLSVLGVSKNMRKLYSDILTCIFLYNGPSKAATKSTGSGIACK